MVFFVTRVRWKGCSEAQMRGTNASTVDHATLASNTSRTSRIIIIIIIIIVIIRTCVNFSAAILSRVCIVSKVFTVVFATHQVPRAFVVRVAVSLPRTAQVESGAVVVVEVDALPATVLAVGDGVKAKVVVKVLTIVPAAFEPVVCVALLTSIAVSLPQTAWTGGRFNRKHFLA